MLGTFVIVGGAGALGRTIYHSNTTCPNCGERACPCASALRGCGAWLTQTALLSRRLRLGRLPSLQNHHSGRGNDVKHRAEGSA